MNLSTSASTAARVCRVHGTSLYLVIALANDQIRDGGMIATLTYYEDILHDDSKALAHGDVCKRHDDGRLIRCGQV